MITMIWWGCFVHILFPDDDGLRFVLVSQNTFHSTNVAHSTWHTGLILTQCTKVAHSKNILHITYLHSKHTADNCTARFALRCTQLHTVAQHREQENYFHTIHLISISLQADALSFVNQFKQFWQNYCVSIMILQVGNNLKNRRKCVHH